MQIWLRFLIVAHRRTADEYYYTDDHYRSFRRIREHDGR
jgi:guanyl-specific ribonuclease Sa